MLLMDKVLLELKQKVICAKYGSDFRPLSDNDMIAIAMDISGNNQYLVVGSWELRIILMKLHGLFTVGNIILMMISFNFCM